MLKLVKEPKKKSSRHHHEGLAPQFDALAGNSFGSCTCLHCHQEVGLDAAFNEYFIIFERIVDRINEAHFSENPEVGDEKEPEGG